MIILNCYLFGPAFYQSFIKGVEGSGLSLHKILQFRNALDLFILGGGIDRALLFLFSEFENFLGDLIVDLLVVGLPKKLLLEICQFCIDAISSCFLCLADDLCNVLL